MRRVLASIHTQWRCVTSNPSLIILSAADSVSDKQKKRRHSISSEADSSDVQSASTGTQHRIKTGPNRRVLSICRSRKPIPELTLADHDATQTTLKDYNFVKHPQTTPVSTYPPHTITSDKRERSRSCLFPFSPGECMCAVAYIRSCIHVQCGLMICTFVVYMCVCMRLHVRMYMCIVYVSPFIVMIKARFTLHTRDLFCSTTIFGAHACRRERKCRFKDAEAS